uniref:ADP-ribosylation factor-like protein 2-binding protein n=1 Tax=Phytophthora ramorum TaxID=164328 RepID=H3H109_PHYRM
MSSVEEAMNQPEMADFDEEVFDNDVGEENTEEAMFDEMIGVLQDILIDPDFVDMQSEFCRNNCGSILMVLAVMLLGQADSFALCRIAEIFDNVSENKLIYMDIFQQYTDLIETFIERRLHEKLEVTNSTNNEQVRSFFLTNSAFTFVIVDLQYFSMDELCNQIQEHEDEIPLDVIDVLLSSSDFEEFKSLMLSFKQNETPCIEITGDALICCGE